LSVVTFVLSVVSVRLVLLALRDAFTSPDVLTVRTGVKSADEEVLEELVLSTVPVLETVVPEDVPVTRVGV